MNRFRHFIPLLLCLAMVLGILCGCQKDPSKDLTANQPTVSSQDTPALDPENHLIPIVDKAWSLDRPKNYTMMIYMVGSDLESQNGCASSDLMEMLNSGLRGSNANLLVYTGGAASWNVNVRSDVNTVFALDDEGTTLNEVAYTNQPENMGDPATLRDFLNYAVSYYPSENYGLILWDHGGGPLYGFGSDELYNYDSLGLWELEQALAASPFAQQKLGFIGFDACLMASLEVAVTVSPYANYLVASQETEPGTGWDYSFLSDLNFSGDSWSLSQSILRTYEASMLSSPWNPEYTLSCINLAAVDNLAVSLDTVWISLLNTMDRSYFNDVARSRSNTKCFGLGAVSDRGNSLDLVDIGSLLNNLPQQTNQYALQKVALNSAVIFQVTNLPEASGLSLYFPYDNKAQYQYGGYQFDSDSPLVTYTDFLNCYAYYWLGTRAAVNWEEAQSLSQTDEALEIKLEEQLLENLGSVTYSILKQDPADESYWPMVVEQSVTPAPDGTVTISRNPDVFMLHTDNEPSGDSGVLWPVTMVESTLTKNSYITSSTMLMPNSDAVSSSWEIVQIAFSDDLATGQVTIQNVLARAGTETATYGKQDVDISHWGVIGYSWNPITVSYDTDGQMLPCTQWDDNGNTVINYSYYDNIFHFEKAQLQSQEGAFYCQIVVRDAAGNVLGTQLEELYTNTPYKEKTVSTENGQMIFHIYEDYAQLVDFQAKAFESDTLPHGNYAITVPAKVSGVPVTNIGSRAFHSWDIEKIQLPDTIESIGFSAFSGCYNLKELNIPASVKTIANDALAWTQISSVDLPEGLQWLGAGCLAGTEITQMTIPASVSYIGNGAFMSCHSLDSIQVAQGNAAYQSIDGVLFSADGTQLKAYPEAKGDAYTVPNGTLEIAPDAFRYNETLKQVSFPEGLKSIGIAAFSETYGLQAIQLPDSLEYIGNDAFGYDINISYDVEQVTIPTLSIGPNVNWIGTEAFSGYLIGAYRVAENNQHYSSADGCLLNAGGTQLIAIPSNIQGAFRVPDGVNFIGWSVFENSDGITELTIPDSVVAISNMANVPSNLVNLTVGKGLMNWANLDEFHFVESIAISADNAHFTIGQDGSIYSKDMTTLHLYRGNGQEFAVPEGVTTIARGAFHSDDLLTTLTLPASLERFFIFSSFDAPKALEAIQVAADNANYASHDGLLYTKDATHLVYCPLGKTGTVTVQDGTQEIDSYAFGYGMLCDTLILPEGVTTIHHGNFHSAWSGPVLHLYLPASLTNINADTFEYADEDQLIIHCPADSAAEELAEELGFTVDNSRI